MVTRDGYESALRPSEVEGALVFINNCEPEEVWIEARSVLTLRSPWERQEPAPEELDEEEESTDV